VKGFAQIVIGPSFETFDPFMPGIAGGQNQYRYLVAIGSP
jgi:hypothetical protein